MLRDMDALAQGRLELATAVAEQRVRDAMNVNEAAARAWKQTVMPRCARMISRTKRRPTQEFAQN